MVITALTRNFWKLQPLRPLKMSAAQGFAWVRISQFHIVLACFSCIPPEQGSHLSNTESCPSGRRCSTRNAVDRKVSRVRIPNSPPKTQSYQGFCPYDWAFLFSQGHIGVHDFRQELRYASRSALCPAESGYCPLHLPSHSCICLRGTPLARSSEAQLWRRSWKRMWRKLFFSSSFGNDAVR